MLVWGLEWARAASRRRLFYINVAVPLLLVAPIAMGDAPAQHAAVAYSILFVFFGTFGAAIPVVRDGDSGFLRRVALTGVAPARLVLDRTTAGGILDLVQLLPAVVLIGILGRAGAMELVLGAGSVALALLTANVIGLWVAASARSIAEAALFGAVVSLLLLHGSGVFRTPRPGSVGSFVEAIAPYRGLREVVLSLAGASATTTPAAIVMQGAWVLALWAITRVGSGWILGRLAWRHPV